MMRDSTWSVVSQQIITPFSEDVVKIHQQRRADQSSNIYLAKLTLGLVVQKLTYVHQARSARRMTLIAMQRMV
jgi:hypothetical protein